MNAQLIQEIDDYGYSANIANARNPHPITCSSFIEPYIAHFGQLDRRGFPKKSCGTRIQK